MEKLNESKQEQLLTILLMDLVENELLTLDEAVLARKNYLQGNDTRETGVVQ